MPDRPLICGFLKARNEVIREGNIYRALANLSQFCDVIVACDDASTDGTADVLAGHPLVTLLRVPPERQDFRRELEVKQAMLGIVHTIKPEWIWWHDADEELERAGVEGIRAFCSMMCQSGYSAFRSHYIQLWRSNFHARVDSGFGDGRFIKLWRYRDDLAFDVRDGTHHHQFPRQIAERLHAVQELPWRTIHWGNVGKNLVWKCIQYWGGLGDVYRHMDFERAEYVHPSSLTTWPLIAESPPRPFSETEKTRIRQMKNLRGVRRLFTVIIPTYNRVHTLARALDSLLAQTYEHWVAVVLDDGSRDGTHRLMAAYQGRDPRIFYARYHENRGGVAMNEIGMALACEFGEYWTRLGSDDYFEPHKLELDAKALDAAEACYGPYRDLRGERLDEMSNSPALASDTRAALLRGSFCVSWANVAVRTDVLRRVRARFGNFCDPRLRNMEDFLVNVRIAAVTDGFHFRARVGREFVLLRDGAGPSGFEHDAVWNVASDGASANAPLTARDLALTQEIISQEREKGLLG